MGASAGITTVAAVLLRGETKASIVPARLAGFTTKPQSCAQVKRSNPPTLSKPTGYTHVVEVAATYAFLFVLFGSFYEKSGGGQLFFELASALGDELFDSL